MPQKRDITIGGLAKASGIKVTTIRYYENIGLIDPPARTAGGQRLYDQQAVDRMRFIRHGRDLGLSLDAIRELIALSADKDRSCADVDTIVKRHAKDVRQRIARLQSLEKELNRMISECAANRIADCRVMEILANHELCETEHLTAQNA